MISTKILYSLVFLIGFLVNPISLLSQQIELENALKNFRDEFKSSKKIKVSGGFSSSFTAASSTTGGMRDPFNYMLNGNLTFSFYKISIPVSLSFTNAGFSYNYQYPRLPSRLSLHPKYKSVQGHFGDFSMNFSPYTMSGFVITGVGVDIAPTGKFKYSSFWGQFQKAVPYKPNNGNTLATFKRLGGGVKLSHNGTKSENSLSAIYISDVENSLKVNYDSVRVYPKSNWAFSYSTKYKFSKAFSFQAELGFSLLTNDIRASKDSTPALLQKTFSFLKNVNGSTNFYKAIKTGFEYVIGSSNVGVHYERIDPSYQTLGAYYFANDLENITASFAQQLFNGKLNLAVNAGLQHDDLKNEKTGKNNRMVFSANSSFNGGKKFTATITYSNFQTFTNVKPQFQYINQLTPYDNLDTLNFRQLSQQANATLNFMLRSNKERSDILNFTFGLQDSYDMQGGIIAKGNASQYFNFSSVYSQNRNEKNLNVSVGLNATYNTIGSNEIFTAGPMLSASKPFWKKKLRSSVSFAYNASYQNKQSQQSVIALRGNVAGNIYKKHSIGLNTTYMRRVLKSIPGNDFSTTLTYSYSF